MPVTSLEPLGSSRQHEKPVRCAVSHVKASSRRHPPAGDPCTADSADLPIGADPLDGARTVSCARPSVPAEVELKLRQLHEVTHQCGCHWCCVDQCYAQNAGAANEGGWEMQGRLSNMHLRHHAFRPATNTQATPRCKNSLSAQHTAQHRGTAGWSHKEFAEWSAEIPAPCYAVFDTTTLSLQ